MGDLICQCGERFRMRRDARKHGINKHPPVTANATTTQRRQPPRRIVFLPEEEEGGGPSSIKEQDSQPQPPSLIAPAEPSIVPPQHQGVLMDLLGQYDEGESDPEEDAPKVQNPTRGLLQLQFYGEEQEDDDTDNSVILTSLPQGRKTPKSTSVPAAITSSGTTNPASDFLQSSDPKQIALQALDRLESSFWCPM
jgi:hypothetical protein